ncbi:hypothetical protein FGO68_gene8842 [Halteria grandinella]|uniref:Uncharacterized protein n=1 Tax=Halteria grandinella TaxID=5974 RepID=A0A8J8SUT3_HALGN|nr:hypothetical protein FGO68_gene8842 [Halteria grandinella]
MLLQLLSQYCSRVYQSYTMVGFQSCSSIIGRFVLYCVPLCILKEILELLPLYLFTSSKALSLPVHNPPLRSLHRIHC